MKPFRRILHSSTAKRLLCRLGAWYLRLVRASGRWTTVDGGAAEALWDRGEPFIACCWHGQLLMMPAAWRPGAPVAVLVSHHRDGELVAETVRHLGVGTVRGSSSRGGAPALVAMLKALDEGISIGITPDGPRGPRMRASDGVVAVARRSGRPILPIACSASTRFLLATWDRIAIPLPFTRGACVWGAPIRVPRDASRDGLESARLAVEERLKGLTAEADRLAGQDTVGPDPAPADKQAPREAPGQGPEPGR